MRLGGQIGLHVVSLIASNPRSIQKAPLAATAKTACFVFDERGTIDGVSRENCAVAKGLIKEQCKEWVNSPQMALTRGTCTTLCFQKDLSEKSHNSGFLWMFV